MDIELYKKVLKERGWTYKDLAIETDISLCNISRIMAGIVTNPRYSTIEAIEKALGINLYTHEERVSGIQETRNATNLRALRKQNNLTIAQVAEKLNLPFETYRSYEAGKNQADYETLVKLADFFGVTVDYLLGREEEKNLIERPPYEITDKQLIDFIKLYKVMTEIQKAQVLGYVIGLLEQAGVNVKTVLGY